MHRAPRVPCATLLVRIHGRFIYKEHTSTHIHDYLKLVTPSHLGLTRAGLDCALTPLPRPTKKKRAATLPYPTI